MNGSRWLEVMCVARARPNFVKLAPIVAALDDHPACEAVILHTGQHYDARMTSVFFRDLGIRKPDLSLDIGSGGHAVQTAKVMIGMDEVIDARRPDVVLVIGDVNSTVAAALVARKKRHTGRPCRGGIAQF